MRTSLLGKALLAALCLLLAAPANAQSLANYTSARSTGAAYASINTGGSAFNSWRNTGTFTQDDNRSDFTDIGFDFWYDGVRYTKFCVSTNGFIDFSTSTDNGDGTADDFGYNNASFTTNNTANSTNPAIAPFYDDLTAQGGTDALGNSIKYNVTGSAPNRVLTIEWINMAVYGNTTPSLNFQVELHESTGIVTVNYGTMTQGTFTFSYSMGLNGPTLSAVPTAAQLKMLQTVNTNVLSNTVQNNLSAMPAGNSKYVFTPPVPTAVSGSLSFSGVTQSSMSLNWPNWAANEVGYVIYNSTDGINYSFVSQSAANAVTASVTGLLPSTTYYWQVYAVTEGCLSSPLTGTQATSAAGNKISNTTGSWSNAAIWTPVGVPTAADNVTISNGNTVTIDINAQCNALTVGTGAAATLQFGTATARTLTVNSNVVVSSSAVFNVLTTSNVTHSLLAKGNITNNGTLNFATDANSLCNTTFFKDGNQALSGNAMTLNTITLNMGSSINNTLDITANAITVPTNFLTLTSGTFKLSTVSAVNITPFTVGSTLPQGTGLWVNSATAVVNTGAGITLYGTMAVTNGTLNVGNAADEDLLSSGGTLSVSGGLLNIAGKYYSVGINNLSYFNVTGGTVIVPATGSTNTTIAPFQMTGPGSQFAMSGGLLIVPREGGTGAQDLGFVNTGATSGAVTGGTLQIGSAASPAAQIISINSIWPVGSLLVNSANVTATLLTNTLSITNNVSIATGTLNANNLDMSLGGNWINSGGLFTPGTASVTMNSSVAQSIFKSGGETFNHLTFSGSGLKTFGSAVNTNGNFTINSGAPVDVSSSSFQLGVKGNFSNSGSFNMQKGLVLLNGTAAQNIGGSTTTNFYDLTLSNTAGASLQSAENLVRTLTLSNGVFNTNSQAFTMLSTAGNTARIAQITGTGDISGNVTAQRFAPGGTTGWALLGTPISSALTLADWNDNFAISCQGCPNGTAAGFISVYTYDETVSGVYDNPAAYIPLSGITDPIVAGKGYWVYLGTALNNTADITIDVTGTPRKFNYSIPLKYTNTGSAADDGWNLITNPYPSPIKWSLLKGATTGIDNAVYSYNADLNGGSGGYATYINGISSPALSAGGISDTIPMSQGFYVHSTGATSLAAQESNKVSGNPTFMKTASVAQAGANANPLLRLYLDGSGTYHDEAVLYLQAGATNAFDQDYDAYKMRGQDPYAPLIALQKGVQQFQVNGVAPVTGNFSMPLEAYTGYAGNFTISADNIGSFPPGACITLYDTYNGSTTNLRTGSYTCFLSDTTVAPRFVLNITIDPLQVSSHINQPSCLLPHNGEIRAIGASSGPWNYYWKDNTGGVVKTSLNKASADTLNQLSGGSYTLQVNTVGMCDNSENPFTIEAAEMPLAQFNCADTTDLASGATVFNNTGSGGASYLWNFGDGTGTSSAYAPVYNYGAPGTYTVRLVSTSGSSCSDTAVRSIVVLNTTGIQSFGASQALILKTMGNNDFVLQENLAGEEMQAIRVMDALGKIAIDYGSLHVKTLSLPVNLQGYQPGIYFLEITGSSTKQVIKLPVH